MDEQNVGKNLTRKNTKKEKKQERDSESRLWVSDGREI